MLVVEYFLDQVFYLDTHPYFLDASAALGKLTFQYIKQGMAKQN